MGTCPLDIGKLKSALGPFDEFEYLDSGTFGSTFRVVRGDDQYAIKVMHLDDMPEYLLEREIRSLEVVDHPNVVALEGAGRVVIESKSYPYIECEFVDGPTIEKQVESKALPSNPEELKGLLVGLLRGTQEIHDLGIIHRDIKPGNVILRQGDWANPVLLDFGLAKVLDMSSHTLLGQAKGTPAFMAPEQLRGDPARRRSDLFSVAAVVYIAGTGSHPFITSGGMTIDELHEKTLEGQVVDPRGINAIWEDETAEVVLRLLSYPAHARLGVTRALLDLDEDPNADE